MSNFAPTAEQQAIIAAALSTSDNLLISALAGAAKTSTLEMVANQLPPKLNGIFLAFNKKIADEARHKFPSNFTVKTLNALGHAIWRQTVGGNLRLDTRKCYNILSDIIAGLSSDDQKEAWDSSGFVLKSVQSLKAGGYVPNACHAAHPSQRLLDDADITLELPEEPSPLELDLILEVSRLSIEQAFSGIIDFGDQILMPAVFKATYPIHTLIMIDEAQDLSQLNHMMLNKLYRRRIIAVGDQNQAIYGFRGAHETGMAEMKKLFDMKELHLSCSFRCPPAIVEHVLWRAPNMTAWEGNPHQGEIFHSTLWNLSDLPDNCAVICRNNAPLFALAVRLLATGRYPNLWGNDIGAGLLKAMKTFGPRNTSQEQALVSLAQYHHDKAQRVRNLASLQDRVDCIKVFLQAKPTLGEAMDYATQILNAQGRVNFMTGHKAKGHEFDHVFFLDSELLGDQGQENNLRYVICTRAQQTLSYIDTIGCEELMQLSPGEVA